MPLLWSIESIFCFLFFSACNRLSRSLWYLVLFSMDLSTVAFCCLNRATSLRPCALSFSLASFTPVSQCRLATSNFSNFTAYKLALAVDVVCRKMIRFVVCAVKAVRVAFENAIASQGSLAALELLCEPSYRVPIVCLHITRNETQRLFHVLQCPSEILKFEFCHRPIQEYRGECLGNVSGCSNSIIILFDRMSISSEARTQEKQNTSRVSSLQLCLGTCWLSYAKQTFLHA